ncbi:MAG TPA: DUF3108 domain-containing protein [Gemmatimonadaceae bacterium]|nr:DUF3108 domain-containing protein [Gemmatimonadaceae bacterium]
MINCARIFRAVRIIAVLSTVVRAAHAQQDTPASPITESAQSAPVVRPYGVGEKLVYDLAVGGAKVGTGTMSIIAGDAIEGHDIYHSIFDIKGGFLFFKVDDRLESWFEPATATSHRFYQRINEGSYHKERYFEIYPDSAKLHQRGFEQKESVHDPLDDASFFYFVRTVPLVIGETYTYTRYFRPENNPVIVKVLRREKITVDAGKFNTIVLQPIIKSGGLFADGGEALIWVTDDDRRIMVQLRAKMPVLKSLDLFLKSYTPPTIPPR